MKKIIIPLAAPLLHLHTHISCADGTPVYVTKLEYLNDMRATMFISNKMNCYA